MMIWIKLLIGFLLIIGSVAWIARAPSFAVLLSKVGINVPTNSALNDFLTVLNGAIPPLVFLLGVFIVWLEIDEWRIERELEKEEKKSRRKEKKK
jgi:hypothetical protein